MDGIHREFQVFAKPTGAICNLDCKYCYYLKKEYLYPHDESFTMPDDMVEEYIIQHIKATAGEHIRFSWHGGEPTTLGLDFFKKIVSLQKKYTPPNKSISNNIQTNGLLINEKWCEFFASEGFNIGLSMDGPAEMHDRYRVTKGGGPTHRQVFRAYKLFRQYRIPCDILCVVSSCNAQHPTRLYRYFREIKAKYIGLLPLVERIPGTEDAVSERSVSPDALGGFLCDIFDEWKNNDIGRIIVQMFEEIARTAMGQDHSLCIFRRTCGDFPVVEHNGDFYSCDHFVDPGHRLGNIHNTPLAVLLNSPGQKEFGQNKQTTLPRYCRQCSVLNMCNGGCPKDRFIKTPDGEGGFNYLCRGYKQFFSHCRPFVRGLQTLTDGSNIPSRGNASGGTSTTQTIKKIGRNDPCPCGSGRKYKKCCLNK